VFLTDWQGRQRIVDEVVRDLNCPYCDIPGKWIKKRFKDRKGKTTERALVFKFYEKSLNTKIQEAR